MNTAAEILAYASLHHIHLAAVDGKLILEATDDALTDEFLKVAKHHKIELLEALLKHKDLPFYEPCVLTQMKEVVQDLPITVDQFLTLTTVEVREDIRAGSVPREAIRFYAKSFAEGIRTGRILFHPTTGALVRHGC